MPRKDEDPERLERHASIAVMSTWLAEAKKPDADKAFLAKTMAPMWEFANEILAEADAEKAAADKAAADKAAAEQIAAEIAAAQLKFDAADAKVKRLDQEIAASEKHVADLKFELEQNNRGVAIATLSFLSAQSKVDAIIKRLADKQGSDAELLKLSREEVQRLFEKGTGAEK